MTPAQEKALVWLHQHGGSATPLRNGTYLAAGEVAPVMRSTWNTLDALLLVDLGSKKRLTLTPNGIEVAKCLETRVSASPPCERDDELYSDVGEE